MMHVTYVTTLGGGGGGGVYKGEWNNELSLYACIVHSQWNYCVRSIALC